jgi:biofilm protein TabA
LSLLAIDHAPAKLVKPLITFPKETTMIVADLKELYRQIPASPRLAQALDYIQAVNPQEMPDGRYEIDGDKVYALVQSYQTLIIDENAKYEAHRKYIDVQYIASGVEIMGWAPLDKMQANKEYNPEKDVILGTCPPDLATLTRVEAGQAAIFFPQDAHAPKLACGEPTPIKKIVVKVAVD